MSRKPYPRNGADRGPTFEPATQPVVLTLYTCPLACSEEMPAMELMEHVAKTAEAAVQTMRRQYASTGISEHANAASLAIRARYAALLVTAIPGPVPDWRNSDGLRGYAAGIIRVVPREEMELDQ